MSEILSMKKIKDLKGKRVLLRLDLNLPMNNGEILDDFRLRKILPTLEFLKKNGTKIIILSHIGRKKTDSLAPVVKHLNIFFKSRLVLNYKKIGEIKEGEIIVLENLRQYEGEEKNNDNFTKELASLGDIYINEAFAVSHRKHASIIGLPKYLPSYTGLLFEEEVNNLSKVLNPPTPFLFILGGAKFETKMPLIEKYLSIADTLFIGGALANNFFKEKNFEIGRSIFDDDVHLGKIVNNKNIILPKDVVVENKGHKIIKKPEKVIKEDKILDAGPAAILELKGLVNRSEFVLWNGPLGDYEHGFAKGTEDLLEIIAESNIFSIIGGGDTVSLISKLKLEDKFSFISTGGGSMLDFLIKGTLPGIKALENSPLNN